MKDASGNLTVNSFVSWVTDSIDSIVPSRNLGSVEIERKEGYMAAGVMYRLGGDQASSCHSYAAVYPEAKRPQPQSIFYHHGTVFVHCATNKDLTVATIMFNSDHTKLAGFSGSRKVCSCQSYNTLPTTHHYINITRASLPSPSVRPSLPPSLHTQHTPLACLVMSIPWSGRKLPRVSHSSCGVSF